MTIHTDPSVSALRAEAESTRARLRTTVEDLRTQVADTTNEIKDRLAPAAIKAEVSQYVRESGDQLWRRLESKARANPLQAVAVGAAVALPALSLLRALPAPLLLIGAGLLLSRSSVTESTSNAMTGLKEQFREHMDETLGTARSNFEQAADVARRTVHDARDYVQDSVAKASSTAASIKERIGDATVGATSSIQESASDLKSRGEELLKRTRETVTETWDKNPLLVAGIGLGIGAFIAAAFPATRTEKAVFGEASESVRRAAENAATEGLGNVKSAVERAANAASKEGLSVEGLNEFGQSVTEKVRAVAERGVEAALGEENTKQSSNSETNQPAGQSRSQ